MINIQMFAFSTQTRKLMHDLYSWWDSWNCLAQISILILCFPEFFLTMFC